MSRRARGLKWSETPKLRTKMLRISGGYFGELGRTGRARENLHGEMAEVCDKYFARALDRRFQDGYIRDEGRERELEFVEFPVIIVGSCQICSRVHPDLPAAAALAALETPNSQAPASQSFGSWTCWMSRWSRPGV